MVLPPNGASGVGDPESGGLDPQPGVWTIDRSSTVGFVARQFLVHRVRGRFGSFRATVQVAAGLDGATIDGEVDTESVVTGDRTRDDHLRSADFFNATRWPTMRLVGRISRSGPHGYTAKTNLTIRDVTRPVVFDVRLLGTTASTGSRPAITATALATINRKDFGLRWNATLETGGVVVADNVDLVLDLVARRSPT